MKWFPWLLILALVLTQHSAAAVKSIAPDETAIAKALADKSKPAKASWWGFDPEDSTGFLQAAINSGVKQLVIDNLGAPWITKGLRLASNQEIIFEKDVLVLAKRGAFKNRSAPLFHASLKENITLTGHDGATLRMWKEDYDDPEQYEKGEWRHVLSFLSCTQVRITGLTLSDSGGDGIYLGVIKPGVPCSDVVIKNVRCINNYRQGISVISARNLLIEDCLFKDTSGTAPQAGIDFEPNHADEELTNCIIRNCIAENNGGHGFHFYLTHLNEKSTPISIRMENCRAIGNRSSFNLAIPPRGEKLGVKGSLELIDCEFSGSNEAAINIRDKTISAALVRFENCRIINPAAEQPEITPIQFSSLSSAPETFGGIHFENCRLEDPLARLPMSYRDASKAVGIDDITGTIRQNTSAHEETLHELTQDLVFSWMSSPPYKRITPFDLSAHHFVPLRKDEALDLSPNHGARFRQRPQWLLWAEAGDEVSYECEVLSVGNTAPAEMSLAVFTPSGELLEPVHALENGKQNFEFKAEETGSYKLIATTYTWTATLNSASHRLVSFSASSRFHLFQSTAEFYFLRPAGDAEFAVKVLGGGGVEYVKAALIGPQGKLVEEADKISVAHQFAVSTPAENDEIWSLRLGRPSEGYLDDYFIRFEGIPPLLAEHPDDLLRPVLGEPEAKTKSE